MAAPDLIIIGTGPGGQAAALHAAQNGLRTVCIEKEEQPGGVCLRVGCIPSKALLDSSELFAQALGHLGEHGIHLGEVRLDLGAMMARKDRVVADLSRLVRQSLDSRAIELVRGTAALVEPGHVRVRTAEGEQTLSAGRILLATGSEPIEIPTLPFDRERIVSSTEALAFDQVPGHLGVVGGGFIGLELGSIWLRLGAKVTVIERLPAIAAGLDGQVARTLARVLKRQGFAFRLNTAVKAATVDQSGVTVVVEGGEGDETLQFDRLLVAAGRRPLTRGLGLEGIGVRIDGRSGQVLVDSAWQTSVAGIYAIGDLVPGPMLAHKAAAEGVAVVEAMLGRFAEVNYDAIPAIVYTAPEAAGVGLTEEQAKERGIPCRTGIAPFSGSGRARCLGAADGLVKLIAHGRTDRILGVHILGVRAAEMIAEAVLALELGASSEDVARTVHGHPTFSETMKEAALALAAHH